MKALTIQIVILLSLVLGINNAQATIEAIELVEVDRNGIPVHPVEPAELFYGYKVLTLNTASETIDFETIRSEQDACGSTIVAGITTDGLELQMTDHRTRLCDDLQPNIIELKLDGATSYALRNELLN